MAEQIEIGNPPIPIRIVHSTRARRYALRISNKDGSVRLTLPRFSEITEAIQFAQEHEGWMRKHLAKQLKPLYPKFETRILFDGAHCLIEPGQGRRVKFENGVLYVPGPSETVAAKLRGFFKTLARDRLVAASQHYADKLGQSFGRVTLRDTRSRWGSCTSDGNLMYSWRLIMAPEAVQTYVAAHEVCHLIEMNHSTAFWNLVERLCPDYRSKRKWLKANGALLHRYQF